MKGVRKAILASAVLAAATLIGSSPASARLARLPAGPPTVALTRPVLGALGKHLVPEEPEITVDVGTDRRGRENIEGGQYAPVMTGGGVLFRLRARAADEVAIAGSFNDWQPERMRRERGARFSTTIDLEPGTWRYAYVVDGLWVQDPDNPVTGRLEEAVGDGLEEVSLLTIRHDEVVMPRAPGSREASFGLRVTYDRVDGADLYGTMEYENRARLHPVLSFLGGYSFGRDRGLYEIGATQPLFAPEAVDIGAAAYRVTDTPDDWRITRTENSLAMFFLRQDWRDYHEAEGVRAFGTLHLGWLGKVTGTWTREEHRALKKTTNWGLLYPSREVRDNWRVDEGTLRSGRISLERDTKNHERNPTRGGWMALSWEQAGDRFGGDFQFQRGLVDLRRYITVSPGYWIDVRLAGGVIQDAARGTDDDRIEGYAAIPIQERFYLGGMGSMRATVFKSIEGDRTLLSNVELRVQAFHDLQVVLFADVGDAWIDAERTHDLKFDGGIGVQDGDANLRINVATKLDDRGGSVIVSGRLQRMF